VNVTFGSATQQTHSISGRVTSVEDNSPLPGVNILEKGTVNGTVTDADGNFTMTVSDNAILVVSSIGFIAEEIPVNATTNFNISLTPDVMMLEQVLVVGYGSQNKSKFTGAAVALNSESLNKSTVSIENLMQGKVSGVQIFQNNATPGSPLSIRIRGTNSINAGSEPLFVIDGMPVADGVGYSLNPSDVESITVLKDAASTAIYGARGANGVIMVTTKRGGDQKGKINVHSYYGVQRVTDQFNLSGPYDHAVRINRLSVENGNTPPYSASRLDSLNRGLIKGTNWQDEAFQTASIQNHDINFSGGSKNTSVFSSLNYLNQDGVIINTNYKRINARLNLEQKIGNKLKMTATAFGNYGVQNDLPLSPSTINGFLKQVVKANPIATPDSNLGAERDARNPLHFAAARDRKNVTLRTQAYFSFQYEIVKGLSAHLDFGADLNKSKAYDFAPSTIPAGASTNGLATITGADQEDILLNPTLNYDKSFGSHNLKLLAGWNAQRTDYFEEGITASNFSSDDFGYNQIGAASSFNAYTFRANPIKRQSWFGRVNYDYKDKYFFTGTYRVDGSSVFGDNQKLGYFPSAALAWRFSEEEFAKTFSALSNGKLRASYGLSGNDRIPGGATKSTFSSDNTTSYTFSGTTVVSGVAATNFPNANLKWEETASFDVGLELGFFNDRIVLEGDYYIKKTTDLLLLKPTPPSTGFTERLSNEAAVENKGIELSLQTKNIDGANFKWSTSITFAKNKNTITRLSQSGAPIYLGAFKPEANANFEDPYILKVGESIGSFYGYINNGIIQQGDTVLTGSHKNGNPGDPRYVNVDGNNILDEKDRVVLGVGIAPITLGITNNFSYRNFSLDILMQGLFGGKLLNVQRADLLNPISSGNVLEDVNTNTWSASDNPSGTIPAQGYYGTNHGGWVNSAFVESGDFLRVKNVTLSYSLSPSFLKGKTISALSIYINAQNILTFSNYSGLDPEVGNTVDISNPLNRQQSRNVARGIDFNAYPVSKLYIIGIRFTL
jgi:TonB-linked SusC/RagA family outer membrane protein